MERYDAAIVGGGIIGLATAWRAEQRGLRVCVIERGEPGGGATHAAAGVLAPDEELGALAARSAGLWPEFADELRDSTGIDLGYTRCGSLLLAFDEADVMGNWLDGDACRALETGISPDCVGGQLAFLAEAHRGQMDDRIKPMDGAGNQRQPMEQQVALLDVREFVQEDLANLRGGVVSARS